MKSFKSKARPDQVNRTESLACIPEHLPGIDWQQTENGEILIEYPLNIKPFFLQIARRFKKGPEPRLTKKLQLDSLGSSVWLMIDGESDVKTIIEKFAEECGLSLQEAEQSVTTFFLQLGQRGLIALK
ncbi:MAG: PqqD family protein [Deltaproteobacteria bacterium]|nr:PqqD family protein [Deltaproteobacteria bacterium]